jgi:hypothetical protein
MNRIAIRSICIFLVSIVFTSGILAQNNLLVNEELPGLKGLLQTGSSGSFDEQLGSETGAMGDVPVDGGITLLLAAGMAYGGKRLAVGRRRRRFF